MAPSLLEPCTPAETETAKVTGNTLTFHLIFKSDFYGASLGI